MKIWQKTNIVTSESIEKFTVGKDRDFDLILAKHDIIGSRAHISMLQNIGLLTIDEWTLLDQALSTIEGQIQAGEFEIQEHIEDIHSQIEWMLTEKLGDVGKKIHTGRSRNDQVAVDIKLYLKEEVNTIKDASLALFKTLITLSEQYKDVLIPGYTHLQVAMPSSIGLWLGAYAESLVDDLNLLKTTYQIIDKNPLGSGAGYGSSFPLNRQMTTQSLGFKTMHYNSIYAQMCRGKAEKWTATGIAAIASTLSKLCMDICLYINQNHNFIYFPEHLTTGSSIMPHKKNPDVFELIRGKCNRLQALPNELTLLLSNLPSGYHRELQLTKEILFPGIEELKSCIAILHFALPLMGVRHNILNDEKYKYIYTVERINQLVNQGLSFRDAYIQVGDAVQNGTFTFNTSQFEYTHEGSIGNLCNKEIQAAMDQVLRSWE